MSDQIPVNPDMLRWARKTGGFDIDDVVVKLKRKRITSETITSWEANHQIAIPSKYSRSTRTWVISASLPVELTS